MTPPPSRKPPFDTDVLIVGAGPTGLLLASELALAGIGVVVVEKRLEPDTTIKAGSVNVATAEIFDRRGLRDAARAAQSDFVASLVSQFRSRAMPSKAEGPSFPVTGHFAGLFFRPDLVDQTAPDLVAHHGVDGSTLLPQAAVEKLLADHARSLGVDVRRGVEVTGFLDSTEATGDEDAGVELRTTAGVLRARWLVAADGGRSPLRKGAGIGFDGTDAEVTGYQAVADLEGAELLKPGWNWTPTGVYTYGPVPGRILTVQFTGSPADRDAPVTAEELQASIRLVTGVDVTVTGLKGAATRWTDNARQAETYRKGRLLLAGDAAHVHSPFSGQGLNLGAGDAVNLGWKLAATIRGTAPAGLLDTYDAERRPIGAWVLDWTRAQVALMRGDVKTGRLRDVMARDVLGTVGGTTRFVALASGIAQRYRVGPGAHPSGVSADEPHEGFALVGRLVGDTPLSDGSRLADHFHDGRFVLVDRSASGTLSAAAEPWAERLAVAADPQPPAAATPSYRDLAGMLVRPDGVIAWVAVSESQENGAALVEALERWAGPVGRS